MDRLNYHHLYYFFTVAREGSIARASARLGLAQPTVSAQIHALEDELGHKLLERSGRGLKITPAGETALRYAAEIFATGGELMSALDGGQPAQPVLAAGVSGSIPQAVVGTLWRKIAELDGPTRLAVTEGAAEMLAAKVASGALQFALTDTPVVNATKRGLQSRVLLQSPVALFAPAGLAHKWSRDFPSRLGGAPIAMSTDGPLRDEAERWLSRSRIAAQIVAEMPNPEFYAAASGAAVFAPMLLKQWLRVTHTLRAVGELKRSQWRLFLITARGAARSAQMAAIQAAAKGLAGAND